MAAFYTAEIRRLYHLVANRLREIAKLRSNSRKDSHSQSQTERNSIDSLWAELLERDAAVNQKEEVLAALRKEIAERADRLEFEAQQLKQDRKALQEQAVQVPPLQRLLPRIDLDEESHSLLQYELQHCEPYVRFTCAMNDGLNIHEHPLCKKHVKLSATKKNQQWWEIRLIDSVAEHYRLYYRHTDADRIELCLRHKKDQQRFLDRH